MRERIAEASRTIFSYCMARTPNREEAEDLCQDILCELVGSSSRLRDEGAFYAFMWAVAGNVYKQWCRKRVKNRTCPLPENLAEVPAAAEDNDDIYLLRRELSLLSEKYRRATVLYYLGAQALRRNRTHPWYQREYGQISAVQIQKNIERRNRNGTKIGYAQLCAQIPCSYVQR